MYNGLARRFLNFNKFIVLFLLLFFNSLLIVNAQNQVPSDKNATEETNMLFNNILKLMDKGIMFGHQEDIAYGVGWVNEKGRSDTKSVTGSYPAIYGWDMARIELDSINNIDGVPFYNMAEYLKDVYKRGGVNTVSWHSNDPVTNLTAWSSPAQSVKLILEDTSYQSRYKQYLDKFAAFFINLKDSKKKSIPIIYRPFHELTGNWFWWGKSSCTPREFIALWRLTIDYLRNQKHLNNLLLAYSVADFKTEKDFLERYPGDDYVDIVGFDLYCDSTNKDDFAKRLNDCSQILEKVAKDHNKIPALTEIGYNQIPVADWWTKTLLPIISRYKYSYMLTWRNWKEDHFFAPYPGQISADDFKLFYDDPKTLFQKDLNSSLYKKPIK